ncbi:hypothetical protein [Magnetospira sp. QH-2]|uniref:hypothetical protein n=1 Tax=Magnetospira sp. (strain QH-2) TaxID=1288970 RepID=UPI0003E816EC|nr:hypothetical protein [Magnetospira sp. QH-2]CCQ74800.1 protein of unknown function [Magnetospira sp. QH-2]
MDGVSGGSGTDTLEGSGGPQTREYGFHMGSTYIQNLPQRRDDESAWLALLDQSSETKTGSQSPLPPGHPVDEQGRTYDPQGRRVPNSNQDPNIHNAGGVVPVPGPLPLPVPPEMIPGHKERTEQLNTLGQWASEKLQQAFPNGIRYKGLPVPPPSPGDNATPRTDMAEPQKPVPPSPAPTPETGQTLPNPAPRPDKGDGTTVYPDQSDQSGPTAHVNPDQSDELEQLNIQEMANGDDKKQARAFAEKFGLDPRKTGRALEKMKKAGGMGGESAYLDFSTGDAYDPKSGEPLGNILDEVQ